MTPPVYTPQEIHNPDLREFQSSPEIPLMSERMDAERNTVSTALELIALGSGLYQ